MSEFAARYLATFYGLQADADTGTHMQSLIEAVPRILADPLRQAGEAAGENSLFDLGPGAHAALLAAARRA